MPQSHVKSAQWCILLTLALLVSLFAGCRAETADAAQASAQTAAGEQAAESQASAAVEPETQTADTADDGASQAPSGEAAASNSEIAGFSEFMQTENPDEAALAVTADDAADAMAELSQSVIAYPLEGGSGQITLWMPYGYGYTTFRSSYNEHFLLPYVLEATGVQMAFTEVSDQNASELFPLMIAAGDYDDVMDIASLYTGGLGQAYEDDVIVDLTDLMAENSPDYYNTLYTSNETTVYDAATDGMLLALYQLNDVSYNTSGMATRGDWLDALGLELPNTLSELTDVLYAFHDAYQCTYTYYVNTTGVMSFARAFDAQLPSIGGTDLALFTQDGRVTSGYASDGFRDYLTWFRQLYVDQIIYNDFYVANLMPNVINTYAGTGEIAFWNTAASNILQASDYAQDAAFQAVPVPVTLADEDAVNTFVAEPSLVGRGSLSVTCDCGNPAYVLQFLNYFFTPEGSIMYNFGVEGETYTVTDDGAYAFTDVILNNPEGMQLTQALHLYTGQPWPGYYLHDQLWAVYSQQSLDCLTVWATPGTGESTYPAGAGLSTQQAASLTNLIADVNTVGDEYILKFMVGGLALDDETWAQYLAALDSCGLGTCLETYQQAYDTYLAGTR